MYAAANLKAMSFIGGGAQNFQDFFEFLGTVKDKRVPPAGSPFQINFPGEPRTPRGMVAVNETVPPCWSSALRCSCGDCPEGPQCSPVRPTLCCIMPCAWGCWEQRDACLAWSGRVMTGEDSSSGLSRRAG